MAKVCSCAIEEAQVLEYSKVLHCYAREPEQAGAQAACWAPSSGAWLGQKLDPQPRRKPCRESQPQGTGKAAPPPHKATPREPTPAAYSDYHPTSSTTWWDPSLSHFTGGFNALKQTSSLRSSR